MTLETFVKSCFIPKHVARKGLAGRTHYVSILKYIVRPDCGERIVKQTTRGAHASGGSLPAWPYLGDIELSDLTADHVRELTSVALRYGYSTQTVKHIRNVIGTIISHAINERAFSGTNPAYTVALPPIVRRRPQNLSVPQLKSILAQLRYPEREIALITIATGMSIAEICALQWKHLNLSGATAFIEGEVVPPSCILVKYSGNPKGLIAQSSTRVRQVQIPDALRSALIRLRRQERVSGDSDFVLTTPSGKPVCPANARDLILKPVGRRLKLPWLSWQMIKRAHGTLLCELRHHLCDDLVPIEH